MHCNRGVPTDEAAVDYMKGRGLEPLQKFPAVTRKWSCLCMRCLRTVNPKLGDVRRNPGGCKWCRARGFNAFEDAVVYLMVHSGYDATKIGITNKAEGRITKHRQRGWQLVTKARVPGEVALLIESGILRWWRIELGLPIYLGRNEMPQGGHTETVDSSEIDLAAVIRRIRLLGLDPESDPLAGTAPEP